MAFRRLTGRSPGARTAGVVFILSGSAGFGSSAILIKLIYRSGAGVLTVLGTRYAIAALLAILAMRLTRRSFPGRRQALTWVGMGVFNLVSAIAFWTALKLDDVSHVAPIVYVFPAIVALTASLLFRERFGLWIWAAVALGIVGAGLLFEAGLAHPKSLLAAGLAVVSAVGVAFFFIAASRAVGEDDWLPATATVFAMATILYLPVVAATGWRPPDGRAWWYLVAVAVVGTFAPFMLFFAGVTRVGATHASILSVSEPVITVCLALAILGERLNVIQAVGIVLVLASFLVAAVKRHDKVKAA